MGQQGAAGGSAPNSTGADATGVLLPLHVRAETRPAWWVAGCRYTLLVTAEDSGGAASLFEIAVPQGHGALLHMHRREDETFHVVEGEVAFSAGGQAIQARPGSVVFAPRGVAHSFYNVGAGEARMMCTATPGGMERFFTDAGVPAQDRTSVPPVMTPEDGARLLRAALEHGIEVQGP
jgi:quercetin dioxygenase-like cupin family protein